MTDNNRYNLRKRKNVSYVDNLEEDLDNVPVVKKQKTSNNSGTDGGKAKVEKLDKKNMTKKQLKNIWDELANNIAKDSDSWISATAIKNYLLNDPILDWLDLYYEDAVKKNPDKFAVNRLLKQLDEEKNKLTVLFEKGNNFEDLIFQELDQKFPGKTVKVVKHRSEINIDNRHLTFKYMQEGVPIIQQALLYNDKNKTFGVADLLVRSDYINDFFDVPLVIQSKLKAPKLKGNYHYLVIDIKWTTLNLCADGVHIRNSERIPAYKGQLAIYNCALGELQGYTPPETYIMSKAWKYEAKGQKVSGYSCFDTLGSVNYLTFDSKYIKKTSDAINWVRKLRSEGHDWVCVPPSVPELYPNMANSNDAPWNKVKSNISKKIDELTMLWMVGVKNRTIGHENGIRKWTDSECTAESLGIKGKKIGPILDRIIKINHPDCKKTMEPDIVTNNLNDWQTKKPLDFYIDFETINNCFKESVMDINYSKTDNNLIFMIGVGYEDNGAWKFKKFYMNELSVDEEAKVIDEFKDFVEQRVNDYMMENGIKDRSSVSPNFFHWSSAEVTCLNIANKRNNYKWDHWFNNVSFVDMYRVFQDEPIVIRGALKFKLKEVANAMFKHGMIKTTWNKEGPSEGLGAMIDAIAYYTAVEKKEVTYELEKKFKLIIDYNEIDCKVVWEIVRFLRTKAQSDEE
jgi:hypothetical protein